MKVIVTLTEPEEKFTVEVDAWARMMFERNAQKHGLPALPTRDAARQYPETYMCICTYYALKKRKQVSITYDEYEARWDGIEGEESGADDTLEDPTSPAQ